MNTYQDKLEIVKKYVLDPINKERCPDVFKNDKTFDLKFDETMSVSQMLTELKAYIELNLENTYVFSKNLKRELSQMKTFEEQGVLGGDTLIIV